MKNIQQIIDTKHGGSWANIKTVKEFHQLRHIATLEEYRDDLYKYMNESVHFIGGMNPSCTLAKGSSVMEIPTKVYIDIVYQYLQDEIDKMYTEWENYTH